MYIIIRVFQSSLHCLPKEMGCASMLTNDLFDSKRVIGESNPEVEAHLVSCAGRGISESILTRPVLLHNKIIDLESTALRLYFCFLGEIYLIKYNLFILWL